MATEEPRRAIDVTIRVHADSDAELVLALRAMVDEFSEQFRVWPMIRSGYTNGLTVDVVRTSITHDAYAAKLRAWLDEQRKAAGAPR